MAPIAAHAATVDITVRGADGQPLADAVVMLATPDKPAGPIHFPWPMVMAQQDIAFVPHVLIVPVGATVSFPNRDRVRHHVYSFSKAKRFEMKLYGREETRSETFNTPGVVALGCNIHDRMSGFIIVVDTPFAAKADAQGHVRLTGVPEGAARVDVWSPSLNVRGNQLSQAVTVTGPSYATTLTVRR
ncbi:MAG TPA: methylamine utilization protein [Sphingomonas sp.]|nr:methylamine utilization protein [Sphingomonas sp.]